MDIYLLVEIHKCSKVMDFYYTAFASAKEVEVLLQLSRDLNFLSQSDFDTLSKKLDEV